MNDNNKKEFFLLVLVKKIVKTKKKSIIPSQDGMYRKKQCQSDFWTMSNQIHLQKQFQFHRL